MTIKGSILPLPAPSLACIRPATPAELLTAFVGAQSGQRCGREIAVHALEVFFPAVQAISDAVRLGLVQETGGILTGNRDPAGIGVAASSKALSWPEVQRLIAFQLLGSAPAGKNGTRIKRDLGAVALRQIYSLDNLPAQPSRGAVRCELLRRIVSQFGEAFSLHLPHPGRSYKFDPMSRGLYLAFAGLKAGSVLEADGALLSSALGGAAGTVGELAATIIRRALRAEQPRTQTREEAFNLDRFAESVRKLARRLETKPYAGRVAIAQVYDAGLEAGLNLGTLDDFKHHLAEAAREGLLDLERYDITGPFDASLKERSRLRFGRDERHFIVNQWI